MPCQDRGPGMDFSRSAILPFRPTSRTMKSVELSLPHRTWARPTGSAIRSWHEPRPWRLPWRVAIYSTCLAVGGIAFLGP